MTHASTREHEVTEDEQRKRDDEARKLAAEAAKEQSERDEDQRRFNALFSGEVELRARAALTVADQPRFDAADLGRSERFNAMTHDERKAYLDAQEKLTVEQRFAPDPNLSPEQQHETEMAQELLLVYLEKRPIPDKLAMQLIGLVKAHNLPPPEGGAMSRRQRNASA